jgi:hypothetical protein
MIFFSNKCGQLGNRLFAFAHLIANATASQHTVVNMSFDEYARYFETTSQDILCRYPATTSWVTSNRFRSWLFVMNKIVLKFLRKINYHSSLIFSVVIADLPEYQFKENKYFDMKDDRFQQVARKKPVVFVYGRFFRDYENLEKYQDSIRNYFKPLPKIQKNVEMHCRLAKQDADVVVGVHIRRGDYVEFAEGKYFYSDQDYFSKMVELQASLPEKRMKFVICSNENIALSHFSRLSVLKGPGHLVEDMYMLSMCDFIMGPPSTFTLWASFYGRKPLYQIRDLNQMTSFDKFTYLPPSVLYNFSFN